LNSWDRKRAYVIASLFLSIGTVGFVGLLITTGGIPSSITELSTKRRPPSEYIRWAAQFLQYGAIILFANFLNSKPDSRWFSGILFGLSFLPAAFLPFYTSQRTSLLLFFISLVVIAYYLDERVTGAKLIALIPIGILTSNTMLLLRKASWKGMSAFDVMSLIHPGSLLGFFEANRGNVVAHAHIVNMVPESINYRFGSTLLNWVVFPIPRSLWPSKPVNLGQELGVLIYARGEGVVGGGAPPLIAGELYLNFSIVGVLLGGIVFGILIGGIAARLRPLSGQETGLAILYTIFMTRFVFGIVRGDLTPTMVRTIQWMIIISPAVIFITRGINNLNQPECGAALETITKSD
jgi:oligosaccharide repeat unit polymerase